VKLFSLLKGLKHCRGQLETKGLVNSTSSTTISELPDEDDGNEVDDPRNDNDDEQS
jgi:hypothetical protein